MLYTLQVFTYSLAMLLVYVLFLRNRPQYHLSRYYLIAMAVLPLLLPLVQLPQRYAERLQGAGIMHIDLPAVMIYDAHAMPAKSISSLWIAYGLVTLLYTAWQAWNGYRLWQLIHRHQRQDHGAYSLVITPGYGPGSFGKYIFCPEAEINNTILIHEQAHIKLHHTQDLVLLNIIQAITWPNVLLVWIKKELKDVHEFQADQMVNPDKTAYAELLLCTVFHTRSLPIMHSFIIHPIKRRIMMLNKNGKASTLKATLQVCAAVCIFSAAVIGAQSCNKKADNTTGKDKAEAEIAINNYNKSGQKENATTATSKYPTETQNGEKILPFADKMPGADYDMKTFLSENLHYPEDARKKGIEGRVIVRFIVDQEGNVVNPVVMRAPDQSLADETIRVMKKMPKWIPGEDKGRKVAVYFTLPVSFKLAN